MKARGGVRAQETQRRCAGVLVSLSFSAQMPPRRSTRLAATPAPKAGAANKSPPRAPKSKQSWADSAGTGDRTGFLGVGGLAGTVLQYAGAGGLLATTPAFAIYL